MRTLVIAALGLAFAAPVASAQAVCLPNDAKGQMLVSYMRKYSVSPSGGDQTVRAALGLPLVSDSTTVKLVTQEATCKKARDAYVANASTSAAVLRPGGRVYVVVIGNTYAVLDPVYRYSTIDEQTIQILDSRFKLLKFFG
jgi:hypothetical protein